MTPETLHDALSLGMALRWQETRGETISDHEPFTVHFEASGLWSGIAATGRIC